MLAKQLLTPILDMQVMPDPPTLTRLLLHAYSYTPTLTRLLLHAYSYTPTDTYCGYASHARPAGARVAPIGCKRLGTAGGSHLLVQKHKY
jgi:hypothetical protein